MTNNQDLAQAYLCNVVATAITDKTNDPVGTKILKAAVSSIPKQVTVDTTSFTNAVINNTNLKDNPPEIQYEDGADLINAWQNKELPKTIDTGLTVGDLIKK